MNEKEILKIEVDVDLKLRKKELLNKLKSISNSIDIEIKQLETNENYIPNSLGILQGEGDAVDVLCGKIAVLNSLNNKISN